MASHDLQEPLRKIRIFCSRLSEKYNNLFDDEARLYLNRMQNSTDRMQQLIQDILTFSKISFEKKEFVNSDLNLILQDTLVDLDMSIKDKQAQIISEKLPELCINPNLVRPLFFNLIGNALKYSKADTPPVIKIYADVNNTTGNKYCRIFFNDNGIGFDQKYSEQIFGMFTRLHPKNEYEGTGVGLALCKKIVEEHEGYISAISTTGVGSTFIVSFPLTLKETRKNGSIHSKN
jgi:light-regulated signal transduction histidine kinase (bacteriophytochrome)